MNKSEKILIITTFAVMVLLALGSYTYAFFEYNAKQENKNIFKTSQCLNVSYVDGESINIPEAEPLTDEQGQSQNKKYTLSMTNNCNTNVNYYAYLNTLPDSTTPESVMKIDVDGTTSQLSTLPTETHDNTIKSKYRIKQGTIEAHQTETITVKAWLSESLIKISEGVGTKFKNKISIEVR